MFFFREHRLGATCYVFSRVMPTQVPEINATCFFFSSMVNGLKSTCIFFSFWRACGARNFHFPLVFLPWRACGEPNPQVFYVFLPWCACSMPYSWVLSPFFALAHRWHALTCMFFSRLFGAPAAVDVLCFFFAPLARINVLCFFFAGFCKFGRNYRVMFFFAGTCEKS